MATEWSARGFGSSSAWNRSLAVFTIFLPSFFCRSFLRFEQTKWQKYVGEKIHRRAKDGVPKSPSPLMISVWTETIN